MTVPEAFRVVRGEGVDVLDQTLLPAEERYLPIRDVGAMCEAIAALRVRGAPLLGTMGAYGLAIAGVREGTGEGALRAAAERIATTRPTAVDLGAVTRSALAAALQVGEDERLEALWAFADRVAEARRREDAEIGRLGADLIAGAQAVLTHCNTGTLATGGMGTALGVVATAWRRGTLERCYATETRPLLQGARLTAWELTRLGIPASLLPDTAAAALIASGMVQAVITGADRIAANGDTANKVGTYGLALAAARSGVPFYIAAPTTTIDAGCADGAGIPIEYRAGSEVGGYGGVRWSPDGVDAYNPAFDVTPADLIAGIVTERGVARAPYGEGIAALLRKPEAG